MMGLPLFVVLLISASSILCYTLVQSLRRNIATVQATGLPFVVVPFFITSVSWLLLQPVFIPLLERLPEKWTNGWLPFLLFGRGWNHGYQPFQVAGADTFISVSPTRNVIHTCDPEVSTQIFRRSDFRKPVELIELLNVFGPGLTGAEGAEGRLYRKVTAPFFTEQTMDQAWRTSIESIVTLMQSVVASQASNQSEWRTLRSMIASMTLHNVFTVCFEKDPDKKSFQLQETIPVGHKIGFRQTVISTLDHIATIAFMPKFILDFSPFPVHRRAYLLSSELHSYLSNLQKGASASSQNRKSKIKEANLLDLLSQARLPPPAITGNTFSFLFAGHEANANTLTIALFLLALYPSVQSSLQHTIDIHLAKCPPKNSTYTTHYPLFKDSLIAAVINETLRLFTILPFLPKTTPELPSSIVVKGRTHILPPNTLVLINTSATHRHPAYWPVPEAPRHGSAPYPVSSFNPDYWLQPQPGGGDFLRPQPGSFVPFSDGGRGCLGRQFAMVELCAQLVGIFSEWSVGLVEDGISGWDGAKIRAEQILSKGVVFNMTLRPGEMVPVQFARRKVKTGSEPL